MTTVKAVLRRRLSAKSHHFKTCAVWVALVLGTSAAQGQLIKPGAAGAAQNLFSKNDLVGFYDLINSAQPGPAKWQPVSGEETIVVPGVEAGDVIEFSNGSKRLRAVFVRREAFRGTNEGRKHQFFVYHFRREHPRMNKLVFNTIPPRFTREYMAAYLRRTGRDAGTIEKLLDRFDWSPADPEKQVRWRKGDGYRKYHTLKWVRQANFRRRRTATSLTAFAVARLHELWNNQSLRAGSASTLFGAKPTSAGPVALRNSNGYLETNCFVFAGEVLEAGFKGMGDTDLANEVQTAYRKWHLPGSAVPLIKRMVNERGWRAYFWSPDVQNPVDCSELHRKHYAYVLRTKHYLDVEISGFIVNYRPTNVTQTYLVNQGEPGRFSRWKKPGQVPRPQVLAALQNVPFALGICTVGIHNFILRNGEIHECHWGQIGSGVYEQHGSLADVHADRTNGHPWNSGVILIPPGIEFAAHRNPPDLYLDRNGKWELAPNIWKK